MPITALSHLVFLYNFLFSISMVTMLNDHNIFLFSSFVDNKFQIHDFVLLLLDHYMNSMVSRITQVDEVQLCAVVSKIGYENKLFNANEKPSQVF